MPPTALGGRKAIESNRPCLADYTTQQNYSQCDSSPALCTTPIGLSYNRRFLTRMPRLKFIKKMIFDGRGAPLAPASRPTPGDWSDTEITGSVLGHSTVLMNFLGIRVLTDPVFSKRVGPGVPPFILGPKRYFSPALSIKELPAPDIIVLSHAHFDHFDVWSLRRFNRKTPIVTARATADLLHCHGFRNVHELDWGQRKIISTQHGPMEVTAIEVAHWGARMMRDDHRGYNGYLLEREGHTVCFAGDTAYTTAFAALRNPRRPINLMLMPIGAYDPWINAHCSPEQAVDMARQAGALNFVPIHHETFRLSVEEMNEPATRLRAALRDQPPQLLAVSIGETFRVPVIGLHALERPA